MPQRACPAEGRPPEELVFAALNVRQQIFNKGTSAQVPFLSPTASFRRATRGDGSMLYFALGNKITNNSH